MEFDLDMDFDLDIAGDAPARAPHEAAGEPLDEWLASAADGVVQLAWEETTFRRRILGICGYDPDAGLALALRPDVDLEDAISLVRDGCDPATAARILL